jgi:hypothetical protein
VPILEYYNVYNVSTTLSIRDCILIVVVSIQPPKLKCNTGTIMPLPDASLPSVEDQAKNTSHLSPLMLNGKGSSLAPQLSVDDSNVEMKNIAAAEPALDAGQTWRHTGDTKTL